MGAGRLPVFNGGRAEGDLLDFPRYERSDLVDHAAAAEVFDNDLGNGLSEVLLNGPTAAELRGRACYLTNLSTWQKCSLEQLDEKLNREL